MQLSLTVHPQNLPLLAWAMLTAESSYSHVPDSALSEQDLEHSVSTGDPGRFASRSSKAWPNTGSHTPATQSALL